MKILAIEKEIKPIDHDKLAQILKDEAHRVYELYTYDFIREIYFSENNQAILVLECDSKEHAAELLGTLPLVEGKLITFKLTELKPYTGYSRFINK